MSWHLKNAAENQQTTVIFFSQGKLKIKPIKQYSK
jgi:hypothetical protein